MKQAKFTNYKGTMRSGIASVKRYELTQKVEYVQPVRQFPARLVVTNAAPLIPLQPARKPLNTLALIQVTTLVLLVANILSVGL